MISWWTDQIRNLNWSMWNFEYSGSIASSLFGALQREFLTIEWTLLRLRREELGESILDWKGTSAESFTKFPLDGMAKVCLCLPFRRRILSFPLVALLSKANYTDRAILFLHSECVPIIPISAYTMLRVAHHEPFWRQHEPMGSFGAVHAVLRPV